MSEKLLYKFEYRNILLYSMNNRIVHSGIITDIDEHLVQVRMMAVVWAYAMPLVLMLAVLFVSLAVCVSETLSALLALLALIPYYMLVYIFRSRIREQVAFQIDAV